jgi:adenylate cyclase
MKSKILVVDDETDLELLIRQKFRRQIRELQYEFVFAFNGVDALAKFQEHPDIDVVLSDINMPEISPLTKTVIVSAYSDMTNIRTAMNRGAFDFITKPVNFEDLDVTMQKTIRHVVQLRDTLKAIKENNILRMYVDESVLNFMDRREFESSLMVNETVVATAVFIDICGFTAITERESADTVVKLINLYFDVMVKEIIAQGGFVDKFMGDAIMAVFRGDYHLDRAIEAALAVRNHVEAMEPTLLYTPKVAIGINTGEVISGNIGSATLRRLDYTVIGDVVNTAQRLQSYAQEGQIIISDAAYQLVKGSFHCEPLGEVMLKNKAKPVAVYAVIE